MHPDDFLLDQLDLHPRATVGCLREQIAAYDNPAMDAAEFLARFAKTVPNFARALGPLLREDLD